MIRQYCDDQPCPHSNGGTCGRGLNPKFRPPSNYTECNNHDWGFVMPEACVKRLQEGKKSATAVAENSQPWELTEQQIFVAKDSVGLPNAENRRVAHAAQQKRWKWLNEPCYEHRQRPITRHINCPICFKQLQAAMEQKG
jgi:hypothetical protein